MSTLPSLPPSMRKDVWIHAHSSGRLWTVCYGKYTLAQFRTMALAEAYCTWFWQRHDLYLMDTRQGRYTIEDLLNKRWYATAKR